MRVTLTIRDKPIRVRLVNVTPQPKFTFQVLKVKLTVNPGG